MIAFFATKAQRHKVTPKTIIFFLVIFLPYSLAGQQSIGFGLHADPVISWFSSDIQEVQNSGARPGFSFGLTFNRYFTPNYSFSTGISLINASGRLVCSDSTKLEFTSLKYKTVTVAPNQPVLYKIQYLAIPIGLKLQTNQIGYVTFFSDVGIDPKIVVGAKADIPSLKITNEKAINELNTFNLSYHITAGIEYSLGGTSAIVAGLNFDNNFLDITKDNGKQPVDKVMHKMVSFRLGLNF
jgi:hypothetical protein